MNKTDVVMGLDIGTTKICAVIAGASASGASMQVIGEGVETSNGIQRGVVVDIDATSASIRSAVDKAERVAGVEVNSAFVGVTGEHISSLNSKGLVAITQNSRQIRDEDVERAIDAARLVVLPPDREIVTAIPRGYFIDGQEGVKSPVGMSGSRLEVNVHIIHGLTTFLQNLAKCVSRAGLKVEGYIPESIAAANAVLTDAEKKLGVAVVDIGGGTTDIAVFSSGSIIHSGVIGVGGNHVTQDVAVGLQCALEEAEQVKLKYGSARLEGVAEDDLFEFFRIGASQPSKLPRSILIQIIEPRISELFQLVEAFLAKGDHRGILPGGVVLTGGGSLLSGIAEVGEKILGVPVRLGKLNSLAGLMEAVSSPTKSTAVGLALHGFDQVLVNHTPRSSGGGFWDRLKGFVMGGE